MPSRSGESAEERRQRLVNDRIQMEKKLSEEKGQPSGTVWLVVGLAVVVAVVIAIGIAGGSGGSEDRPKAPTTTFSPYDELRRTNPSVDSGILRSLSRETSCEVLDAEWFTVDVLADLVREGWGRLSDHFRIREAYNHAVAYRMDQVGC
ncbi:MAG: hypothetical protein OTJ97_09670 [SAR202 cluster bacterium]|nr:hypothetical protein [SAR202 cluster bacterium]